MSRRSKILTFLESLWLRSSHLRIFQIMIKPRSQKWRQKLQASRDRTIWWRVDDVVTRRSLSEHLAGCRRCGRQGHWMNITTQLIPDNDYTAKTSLSATTVWHDMPTLLSLKCTMGEVVIEAQEKRKSWRTLTWRKPYVRGLHLCCWYYLSSFCFHTLSPNATSYRRQTWRGKFIINV